METTAQPPPLAIIDGRSFCERHRIAILISITSVGAILRFATLDRPSVWGDEALTYSRVIGTWDQMFDILKLDGFMPLHYVLYWCLGKYVTLTPSVMRIIPAICGTLMIPAMYLLTRELSSTRTALLAAMLTCVSAYLMRYSHDAKMYMQTWLFVTLNLGCLFLWLRTRKYSAFAGWVLSGMVAGGFNALALIMLIPQPLIFITAGWRKWYHLILFFIGLAIIAAPVAAYYTLMNDWPERTAVAPVLNDPKTEGSWDNSGIGWVEGYNQGSTGPTLVRAAASAYLVGWEWAAGDGWAKIKSWKTKAIFIWPLVTLVGFTLLALLPWKQIDRVNSPKSWQRLFWIGLLLLVPVYGVFYCRSMHGFVSPWEAINSAAQSTRWWCWPIIAVVLLGHFYFSGGNIRQRLVASIKFVSAAFLLFAVCVAAYAFWTHQHEIHWQKIRDKFGSAMNPVDYPQYDWQSIWMPRYLGIIWPALAVAICILLMRLPTRWLRWPIIAVLLGVNLFASIARLWLGGEPPMQRVFDDAKSARDTRGETRVVLSTLDPRHNQKVLFLNSSWYGIYGSAGKYYACVTLGLKPTPAEFREEPNFPDEYRPYLGQLVDPGEIESEMLRPIPLSDTKPPARLVVWERSSEQAPLPDAYPPDDQIIVSLKSNWQLVGKPELFWQFDGNTLGERGWLRRREFQRQNAAAAR